jgi:hypothetical protein
MSLLDQDDCKVTLYSDRKPEEIAAGSLMATAILFAWSFHPGGKETGWAIAIRSDCRGSLELPDSGGSRLWQWPE